MEKIKPEDKTLRIFLHELGHRLANPNASSKWNKYCDIAIGMVRKDMDAEQIYKVLSPRTRKWENVLFWVLIGALTVSEIVLMGWLTHLTWFRG